MRKINSLILAMILVVSIICLGVGLSRIIIYFVGACLKIVIVIFISILIYMFYQIIRRLENPNTNKRFKRKQKVMKDE